DLGVRRQGPPRGFRHRAGDRSCDPEPSLRAVRNHQEERTRHGTRAEHLQADRRVARRLDLGRLRARQRCSLHRRAARGGVSLATTLTFTFTLTALSPSDYAVSLAIQSRYAPCPR